MTMPPSLPGLPGRRRTPSLRLSLLISPPVLESLLPSTLCTLLLPLSLSTERSLLTALPPPPHLPHVLMTGRRPSRLPTSPRKRVGLLAIFGLFSLPRSLLKCISRLLSPLNTHPSSPSLKYYMAKVW